MHVPEPAMMRMTYNIKEATLCSLVLLFLSKLKTFPKVATILNFSSKGTKQILDCLTCSTILIHEYLLCSVLNIF